MTKDTKPGEWLRCNRCGNPKRKGHHWRQRAEKPPVSCPDCRTKYWNKPRVRKKQGDADEGANPPSSITRGSNG